MIELPCPYCGFNCEVPSNVEEKIECPNCRSIFLYIQNSESHGTIDYRPPPEINDGGIQMSELKVYHHELRHNEYEEFYLKYEADKVIAEITEGAISMFRCSETCRGLDLKSPLGKIANIAFKHWNSVEFIQNENTQLQKDKEHLLQNNHHLLDEIERLKEKMERRERHHKYKRCMAMAKQCGSSAQLA